MHFLEQSNERSLLDYSGDVLFWDIDKTYLDTQFSSLRGLLKIPLQTGFDKIAIAGAVPLIRGLRRGPGVAAAHVPLYFISGSPPQLRQTVERKMLLDGVHFDGITFKDQWRLLRQGYFTDIREQVAYKLSAFLLYAQGLSAAARWLCFGDDVEADAEIFVLASEVMAGLRGTPLARRLARLGVSAKRIGPLVDLADSVSYQSAPLIRAFIHLASHREPPVEYGIVYTRSYLQTALVLFDMQRISDECVGAIIKDLRARGILAVTLQQHVDDAVERLQISDEALAVYDRLNAVF